MYGLGFIGAAIFYISRHRFLDGCARLFESHSLAGIFVYESFKHFGM